MSSLLGLSACQPEAGDVESSTVAWSAVFEGAGMQTSSAVAVVGDQVIVGGAFDREVTVEDRSLAGEGGVDSFIAAFDGEKLAWLTAIQGPGEEVIRDLESWEDGIVVVGLVSENAAFSGTPIAVGDGTRPLLAEVSTAGELRELAEFEGEGYSAFTNVVRSPDGNLYVAGDVSGQLNLGTKTLRGTGLAFISGLNVGGKTHWVVGLTPTPVADGTAGSVLVSDLVLAEDGSLFAAGLFKGGMQVAERELEANAALAATPFFLHLSADGELLAASAAAGDSVAEMGHSGHQGISPADHSPFEVMSPALVPLRDGRTLLGVAFGLAMAGHAHDFEAPAISQFATIELDATGDVLHADVMRGSGLIAGKLSLLQTGDAPVQAILSWVGTLDIHGSPLVSNAGRSLLELEWSPGVGVSKPRAVRLPKLSFTTNSACTQSGSTWSAGHVVDLDSGERDALVVRLAP